MGITGDQWFTVGMGIVTVFLGLIAIIILCKVIGLFCSASTKKEVVPKEKNTTSKAQPIENRQEIIAAVSAVIAEELGTDISALKILSFKKI